MPISPIVIQRRHAELGRIRLGQKGDRGQPQKLGAFRFTSPSERYIRDLAELYGGTPQPWDNAGKAEFEVFTTATTIPVIAVKGGLSQWMETWSGGGCVHRCDGERNVEGDLCEYDTTTVTLREKGVEKTYRAHDIAKPTTRLSVMLPELEALGVWRMESHGWNAAAEIPAVAELAQYVGDLVPANLNLVERRAIKDGKTSRFVVPILDLQIGAARLRELAEAMSSGRELGPSSSTPPELAGPTVDPWPAYFTRVEESETTADLGAVWADAVAEHLVGSAAPVTERASEFTAAFKARAAALKAGQGGHEGAPGGVPDTGGNEGEGAVRAAPSPTPTPDADGVVDAELVDDDADAVWEQIVLAGGKQGMTLADLNDGYAAWANGLLASDASAGELRRFLTYLQEQVA